MTESRNSSATIVGQSTTFITDRNHVFEVVTKWPQSSRYKVWNIGRHNFEHEGYIPLAEVYPDYTINPKTLKALHVGDEALCLAVLREAGYHGIDEAEFKKMRRISKSA